MYNALFLFMNCLFKGILTVTLGSFYFYFIMDFVTYKLQGLDPRSFHSLERHMQ